MPETIRVTPDNFRRAETDMYFGNFVRDGALGKFVHRREPTSIDDQDVVRMNRDTLYSSRRVRSRRRSGDHHDAGPGQALHVAAGLGRG